MADVYRADDTVLDRQVAVKVLHAQFAAEENFVHRFRKEAQAVANLNHPNIVSVYDWGRDNGTYFIVMEYLDGRNLRQILDARGALPVNEVINIGRQVCEALDAAHRQNVVHRDVKPHNIVVDPLGQVKVTDFGIARAGSSSTMAMTQPGSILGTAQYISPEQAQGLVADGRSDIYSLGVVLYEMLTGELPFEAENPVALAMKQVHNQARSPRELNPAIPKSLENVILKALAKNPDQRYQNAPDVAQDLGRVLDGETVKKPAAAARSAAETAVIPIPQGSSAPGRRTGRRVLPFLALVPVFLALFGFGYYLATSLVATTSVPSLQGKTVGEATQILEAEGLSLKIADEVADDRVPKDQIISQEPKSGARIRNGGTVEVVVSLGADTITVPDVKDMNVEEATFALARAGLELGTITKVFSDDVPVDKVIRQNPRSGKEAEKGAEVNLVVSKGLSLTAVPNVIGRDQDVAENLIKQKGFRVAVTSEPSDDTTEGEVITQSPEAGTRLKAGATVTLVVSSGSSKVVVPSVVGKTEAQAKSLITGAGLKADVEPWPSGDVEEGEVVSQDPDDGSKVEEGSTVTIWVGTAPEEPDADDGM